MDNLTHTLVGVTLVRAGLGARTPGAMATMVIASNIPDADVVSAFGGAVDYLAAHRGPTHGLLGVVLLALVAGAIVAAWRARRRDSRAEALRSLVPLWKIALAGTVLHVLMDLPTSYGTRILSPFSDTWFALDWVPIIDIYIWAMLLIGIVVTWLKPGARRTIARVVLASIAAFYVVRAGAHLQALERAATTRADGSVAACASAPVLTRHPSVIVAAQAGPGDCLQAAALPGFLSPLQWRLIRQQADGYEMRDIRLGRAEPISPRVFIPSEGDAWVARARATQTARVFLSFSRFPASRSAIMSDGARRVQFVDVRFVGDPPRVLDLNPESRAPFLVTVEIAPSGTVLAERLGP